VNPNPQSPHEHAVSRFAYGVNPTNARDLVGGQDATTPSTGDPQAYFMALVSGKPPTPQTLESLEPQLNAMGWKVSRNASGVAGKVILPDGRYIDVIQNAGLGGTAWQWLEPTSSTGGIPRGGTTGLLGALSNGQIPMMTPGGLSQLFAGGGGPGQETSPLLDYITKQLAVFNAVGNR
jgi:hypothetical protein